MRTARWVLVLAALAWAAACSDSPDSNAGDGGTDTDTDTDTDSDTDSDTDTDTDADGGPGPFACTAVEPGAVSTLVDTVFTVIGTGFADGMTVSVTETTSAATVDLGAATYASSTGASADAAAGEVAVGTYSVTLTNPDSESVTCPDTIAWLAEMPPTVTLVAPDTAWEGLATDAVVSDLQVAVEGTGFEATPMVTWVDVDDPGSRFLAGVVLFADAASLEAICPSETEDMPTGMYWVEVTNPDGLGAFWMEGDVRGEFEVVGTPPPVITEIDPFRSPAADTPTVTITGNYFLDGAIVQLLGVDDAVYETLETFVDSGTMTAIFDVGQGIYPVKVTNPDGQYDIFYSYEATPSSDGHLESFDLVSGMLATARWRHASCAGFDAFGGGYIYTAGGLDAADTVLDDVEVLPVSAFGEPGALWTARQWNGASDPRATNAMTTVRQGLSLVRAGSWLYAVGGANVNTNVAASTALALDTVERARILGLETRPQISGSTLGAGDIDVGTWYYQVSAIGPWGESLASGREMIAGGGGSIQIAWSAVTGATAYNIYRNVDSSGNGGDTRLLASEVTGTSYTDTGATTPAVDGVAPLPLGSLSKWAIVDEEMIDAREGLDAIVVTVPSGEEDVDDKTFLFAVGGRPDATGAGYLVSGERAEVLADGDLGPFVALSYDLQTPRAFYVLLTSQGQNDSGFIPDPDIPLEKSISTEPLYLIAILGDDEHAGTNNDGLTTFEVTEIVTADGDNEAWTVQDETVQGGHPAHGHGALLYFDRMFTFTGVDNENVGSDPLVSGNAASRVEFHPEAADPAYVLDGWQSNSASFDSDRAYYDMVRVNGYVWALAGNDESGPIATIERTLQ